MIPKISIVTTTYNSAATLEETLQSIELQHYPGLDLVVSDAGSTDGTLDIIHRYRHLIARSTSAPDLGISDGFNRGIRMAQGDVVLILNSDDLLCPGALQAFARHYDPRADVLRGNLIIWNPQTGLELRERPSMRFPKVPAGIHVCHGATFIRRDAYERFGLYRTDFRYAMDLELLCRFQRLGATFRQLPFDVQKFRQGGTTAQPLAPKLAEYRKLIRLGGGSAFLASAYTLHLRLVDVEKRILNALFGEDFKRKLRYRSL